MSDRICCPLLAETSDALLTEADVTLVLETCPDCPDGMNRAFQLGDLSPGVEATRLDIDPLTRRLLATPGPL